MFLTSVSILSEYLRDSAAGPSTSSSHRAVGLSVNDLHDNPATEKRVPGGEEHLRH